jgi:hypothetical protein
MYPHHAFHVPTADFRFAVEFGAVRSRGQRRSERVDFFGQLRNVRVGTILFLNARVGTILFLNARVGTDRSAWSDLGWLAVGGDALAALAAGGALASGGGAAAIGCGVAGAAGGDTAVGAGAGGGTAAGDGAGVGFARTSASTAARSIAVVVIATLPGIVSPVRKPRFRNTETKPKREF